VGLLSVFEVGVVVCASAGVLIMAAIPMAAAISAFIKRPLFNALRAAGGDGRRRSNGIAGGMGRWFRALQSAGNSCGAKPADRPRCTTPSGRRRGAAGEERALFEGGSCTIPGAGLSVAAVSRGRFPEAASRPR
jgi:hypothetical protein